MSEAQPRARVRQPVRAKAGLWRRVAAVGWRGLSLRVEALLLLRRILPALEHKPFTDVRLELMPAAAPSVHGADGPAGQRPAVPRRGDPERALPLGRAVASAGRFVPGALCVSQALAAQVMLARRGEPSVIHFGFLRSPGGAVEGHAWLEVDGTVVIGEGGLEHFTRTATFEA